MLKSQTLTRNFRSLASQIIFSCKIYSILKGGLQYSKRFYSTKTTCKTTFDCKKIKTCCETGIELHTKVTWHRWYRQFDIWHPWNLCYLFNSGRNEVFKTMLTGYLLPAPSPIFFLPDPAHPAPAFSIVPTDREPGSGYLFPVLIHIVGDHITV